MAFLRAHKVLIAVYATALALAAVELTNPSIRAGQPENPRWFLDPDTNIVDVSEAVFPDRAASLYFRAYQASLCEGDYAAEPVCRARGPVQPGEIRDLIARSLATGNRSMELALYNYAMVLLQEGADAAEVDAAIRYWRVSYPDSAQPDPREAFREMQRSRQRPAR